MVKELFATPGGGQEPDMFASPRMSRPISGWKSRAWARC